MIKSITLIFVSILLFSCGGDDGPTTPPTPPDSDGDGIADTIDQCPNTPSGQTVNAMGCSLSQLDSDLDGVNDNLDQCPNTPTGESIDAQGCSESQKDDDNDGVTNDNDLCPSIAGHPSTQGCPSLVLGSITDPFHTQSCSPPPINVDWTAATGGSGTGYQYRLHLTHEGGAAKTTAWQNGLNFTLQAGDVSAGEVHTLIIQVKDQTANMQEDYPEIKFHVRGSGDVADVPDPSVWITPAQNSGDAPTVIEWSNISNLTHDVYIDNNLAASGLTLTTFTHGLAAGNYEAKVISRNASGNASEATIEFIVP